MNDCAKVDPEMRFLYQNTGTEIEAAELVRLLNFLGRHDLMEKFVEEDERGKR